MRPSAVLTAVRGLRRRRKVQHRGRPAQGTVVLVHGAWADGSSWSEVIARLQAQSIHVVSVQNPLTCLADDVAAVARALEPLAAPVVLVGHGYGGTVITEAGQLSQVAALVYTAAFAPDNGESTNELLASGPLPGLTAVLRKDSGGYLWFPQEALPDWLAQDLPTENAKALASAQAPIHARALDDRVSEAAWRTRPSWYLVSARDRVIDASLQRAMAARIRADTTTVSASHFAFASHPKETTALIVRAVRSTQG